MGNSPSEQKRHQGRTAPVSDAVGPGNGQAPPIGPPILQCWCRQSDSRRALRIRRQRGGGETCGGAQDSVMRCTLRQRGARRTPRAGPPPWASDSPGPDHPRGHTLAPQAATAGVMWKLLQCPQSRRTVAPPSRPWKRRRRLCESRTAPIPLPRRPARNFWRRVRGVGVGPPPWASASGGHGQNPVRRRVGDRAAGLRDDGEAAVSAIGESRGVRASVGDIVAAAPAPAQGGRGGRPGGRAHLSFPAPWRSAVACVAPFGRSGEVARVPPVGDGEAVHCECGV